MSPKRTPAVLTVGDRPWTLEELRSAWRGPVRVVLGPGCLERLERSRRTILTKRDTTISVTIMNYFSSSSAQIINICPICM